MGKLIERVMSNGDTVTGNGDERGVLVAQIM